MSVRATVKRGWIALILLAVSIAAFGQGTPNVPLLGSINPHAATGYNDCWGYTAPDGREYAFLGVLNGTSIIDISDPAAPVEITFIPGPNSTWKDIKTYQDYAYVVTESSGGMQIIDLSNLPNSATLVATYTGINSSHNIFIDEDNGILYSEGTFSAAVRIFSLADPLAPVELAGFGSECHDIFARDGLLYVSEGNQGTFGVYDVTDPANPVRIQGINVPASGYCHNAWSTEDNQYLMTTEETSGKTIKMWDISNINQPVITDEVLGPSGLAHNTHIKGDFAYVSHYADGLRIYDISDPSNVFEAGYYDTYPSPSSGFDGAWGAYPFFSSGKVLISDRSTGLYIVYFADAADGDPLDPNTPTDLVAYSDYTTPGAMQLTWTDPTNYFNGDTLLPGDFTIEIARDGQNVASVPGGTGQYVDSGLNDGQEYSYDIFSKVTATDSTSRPVSASWIAGGSPVPGAPADLAITLADNGSDLKAVWRNPAVNADGTPMDDFAGVRLYEDGAVLSTFTRTGGDTGRVDSVTFTPSPGTHTYYLTAIDDEAPVNESAPGNSSYSPLSLPFFDEFASAPDPNAGFWINTTADINTIGVNPPSGPNVLNLDGLPSGGETITILPVDLSNAQGTGILLSFWYQPQGTGNAPESGDSLAVDFRNDQGQWITVRNWPGTTVAPFVSESVSLDAENAGTGATFFHSQFQFRFRNIATASTTSSFDNWLIDDVYLGAGTGQAEMVVTPAALADTLMAGARDSLTFRIANPSTQPNTLTFAVNEDPAADWVSVSPASGGVSQGSSRDITVRFDAAGLAAGLYETDLVVTGNAPGNPADTVSVALTVTAAPAAGVSATQLRIVINPGERDSTAFTLSNSGAGVLDFVISDEDILSKRGRQAEAAPRYPAHYYGLELPKGAPDVRRGQPAAMGLGGPDAFGHRWIDSDEPGGPVFTWREIRNTGTQVTLSDDDFAEVTLPFSFDFYGQAKSSIKIGSNGYLSFGADGTDYTNDPVPDATDPNDLIAPFWDDQDPTLGGTIHYAGNADEFIVQWTDIQLYGGSDPNTYQVILKENGQVLFQYLVMDSDVTSATVGIENSDASDGLEVAFNSAYLHDNLAIRIAADSPWLSANPVSGSVAPGGSTDIHAVVDGSGLSAGSYQARLVIASNDPVHPVLNVDVELVVGSVPVMRWAADTLHFDTTAVNQQSVESLWLFNRGSADLMISEIVSTSGVYAVNTTQMTIPAGDSADVEVTFAPTQPGRYTGQLRIAHNVPGVDTVAIELVGVAEPATGIAGSGLPTRFDVSPNYPNPFNPTTRIRFQVPEVAPVSLVIYNMLGQSVRTLVAEQRQPGFYEVEWDGRNELGQRVSSGVYVYRFEAGAFSRVRKMVLLK